MSDKGYFIIKRGFDTFSSLIGSIITLPVIAMACIAILIDDPSAKPIFKQKRVGKNCKEFTMFKLRTMKSNAEEELESVMHMNESDGPMFKIKDDPRITKVGKLLRKTNLDELPQLWNVVAGNMALVGPRPALPREVDEFSDYHKKKFIVRPGITCTWQIAKDRNDIPFEKWIQMDLDYIKNMSPKTDLSILINTAGSVIGMTGR